MSVRLIFYLSIALSLFAAPLHAVEPRLDVRILIDISGSMKKNDPDNLRRPALRLLVGLLPNGSQAGVWVFGKQVGQLVPLGEVNEQWKQRARRQADRISSPGLYTNIEDALRNSVSGWEQPATEDESRHLVLLTDGVVDVSKDQAESAASRDRIIEELLPELAAMGAQTHTVALSDRADHELMRQMAEGTGGWAQKVLDAEALQRVFLKMFEKVGQPDTVPLTGNSFTVDDKINEFTLLLFHGTDGESIRIQTPDGQTFGRDDPVIGARWFPDQGYDLLTVTGPLPGEWKIQASEDPDNRAMIVTDLKMEVSDLPTRIAQGQQLPFQLTFTEDGQPLANHELLQKLKVSLAWVGRKGMQDTQILQDDGEGEDNEAGDGVFQAELNSDRELGAWELIASATSETFTREKRLLLEVMPPVLMELLPLGDGRQQLQLRPVASVIDPNSLWPAAEIRQQGQLLRAVELTPSKDYGLWQGEVASDFFSGEAELHVRLTAKAHSGHGIRTSLDPVALAGSKPAAVAPAVDATPAAAEPVEEQPAIDTNTLVIGFAITNGVLILLGLGAFFLIRRLRRKAAADLFDIADAAEPDKSE